MNPVLFFGEPVLVCRSMPMNIESIVSSIAAESAAPRRADGAPAPVPDRRARITYLLETEDADDSELPLETLLAVPAANFVDNAYRRILGRAPDPAGKAHIESLLASGEFSAIEALGALRFSPEGRQAAKRIPGLWALFCARKLRRKVPVAGAMLQIPFLIAGLPALLRLRRLNTSQTKQSPCRRKTS